MSLSELHPTKIAEICNGYWLNGNVPQFAFHSTVIDSRQMAGNTLFIALKGTHNDGHDFLQAWLTTQSRVQWSRTPIQKLGCPN